MPPRLGDIAGLDFIFKGGGVYSFYMGRRKKKKKSKHLYAENIFGIVFWSKGVWFLCLRRWLVNTLPVPACFLCQIRSETCFGLIWAGSGRPQPLCC